MTRLVFLGTPSAAVPTLEKLASGYGIELVITQPDRPRGRSKRPVPPPVKQAAQQLGLTVAQPGSAAELHERISGDGPFDVGVVVAFGRIIRPQVLDIPKLGYLNVHFSLLPRWRGAAPVERALMAGDTMTGATIIKLDEGLDTGPVLTAQAIDIESEENAGQLTERLSRVGAGLIGSVLDEYLAGDLHPVQQSDDGASYAEKITADDRPLGLDGSVTDVVNKVRGLAPEPAATLDIDGDRHKVFAATRHEAAVAAGTWEVHDGVPVVGAADGAIALLELQPPGKNRQSGEDWVRGRQRSKGVAGRPNTL